MRRRLVPAVLALLLLVPAGAARAADPEPAQPGVVHTRGQTKLDPAGRYIVLVKAAANAKVVRERHAKGDGVRVERTFGKVAKGFTAELSPAQVKALRKDRDIVAVVPDELVEVAGQLVPTGVSRVGTRLSAAARLDGVDQRVDADVAIVDTGIDGSHPDLNVVGGINCSTPDPTAWRDGNGHGTHVAGTVGAIDNGGGVVGVAPGVRLWAVRILDNDGVGFLSWYVCGLDWIASQRDPDDPSRPLFEAVNMSVAKWGRDDLNCGLTNNDVLHQAICRLVASGVTVVAAAANDSNSAAARVPAAYNEVITVSALADTDGKAGGRGGHRCFSWGTYDHDDTFADFSNFGSDVDIIAPGKCIWSTYPGNRYAYSSGTSMAAPAVTGAVALYRATRPWVTAGEPKGALQYLGNWGYYTSTDPDGKPEKLLDVSRLGPAGDFNVSVARPAPIGEAGATLALPVALSRTPTHFERVGLTVDAPGGLSGSISPSSLMGFTAKAATLTLTVPRSTPAGTYPVTITAAEGPRLRTRTIDVVVENDPPVAAVPVLAPAYRNALGGSTTPIRIVWAPARDAASAIDRYEVQHSADWGEFGETVALAGSASSLVRQVALGHSHRFRIRARDAAGNWSPWVEGQPLRIAAVEDNATNMHYTLGWVRASSPWALGGTTTYTQRTGSAVKLSITARQLAVVAPVGPTRGWFQIYVDGIYQATITLYSRVSASRQILWARTFATDASRTIELRAIRSSSRPRVDLDAILVGR